jgi:hypothetical protein
MKTEIFNVERFGLLLRRQITLNMKSWLIALISVAGFIIFISFLNLITTLNDSWIGIFNSLGVVAFFITGIVFTSLSFSEMGTYSKSLQYITLPASRFEKFITAWILSFVFYLLLATVFLVFSSAIMGIISVLMFKGNFLVFNPFTIKNAEILLVYFVGHSMYFLGAAWFKKAAFFKTLLTQFVVQIILNIWIYIWVFIIINPFKMIVNSSNTFINFASFGGNETMLKNLMIGFFIALSVVFMITAWVRFKEREV